MNRSTRQFTLATLFIPLCFGSGWMLGRMDMTGLKKAVVDSYFNRYYAVSGTNTEEAIYYVISNNQAMLQEFANTTPDIHRIEYSGYPTLFNVHISYPKRRETVVKLRSLETVSAVFTVPFMCH